MIAKTTLALSIALVMGASAASAQYEFDASGAPINMHIVDDQMSAFASAGGPSRTRATQAGVSFSSKEKVLFDRASRPYDLGAEQQY